jgi:hypothetical protein
MQFGVKQISMLDPFNHLVRKRNIKNMRITTIHIIAKKRFTQLTSENNIKRNKTINRTI